MMKEKLTQVEHEYLIKQVDKMEQKSASGKKEEVSYISESTKKALGLVGF